MKTRGCLQCRHKTLFYKEKFLDKTGFTSSKGGYCRKANKIFNVRGVINFMFYVIQEVYIT